MNINRVTDAPQKIHSPIANEKKTLTPWQKAGICAATLAAGAALFYLGTQWGSRIQPPGNPPINTNQNCPQTYPTPGTRTESCPECPKSCSDFERSIIEARNQKCKEINLDFAILRELKIAKHCASENDPEACSNSIGWNQELFKICKNGIKGAVPIQCKYLKQLEELINNNKKAGKNILSGVYDANLKTAFWENDVNWKKISNNK